MEGKEPCLMHANFGLSLSPEILIILAYSLEILRNWDLGIDNSGRDGDFDIQP